MEVAKIPVDKIIKGDQPRKSFDEERLEQLANSIKEVGQLQPIIVQKKGNKYLLIAGERRYRAVKDKNKSGEIAAVIFDDDVNIKQIQLVENLQRQDLNPIERAKFINGFIEDNNLTKKAASKKLGVPRTTLTEWLNILEVKPVYQKAVLDPDKALSLSHISLAKALSTRTGDPSKQNQLLDGILKYNFSRKETKAIVDLFHKYLHLSMEEAFSTVLIKREREKISKSFENNTKRYNNKQTKNLVNSFIRLSNNLEDYMEEVGNLESEGERNRLLSEFMYIYQLLETMIPELKNKSLTELINELNTKNVI